MPSPKKGVNYNELYESEEFATDRKQWKTVGTRGPILFLHLISTGCKRQCEKIYIWPILGMSSDVIGYKSDHP